MTPEETARTPIHTADAPSETGTTFRNSIATVDDSGKRIWIFPKKPAGRLHRWRIVVSVVLLTLFFAGPFIKIQGQPFLLLNIFERRFVIFGQAFWPHDFILLAISLIAIFIFIILFTVVFGRVWCGWACPQTVFMEMVFRKIEYLIEGDASSQRRLHREKLSASKIFKKIVKHGIFILISALISHTLMAYLIGVETSVAVIGASPAAHQAGFSGMVAFTAVFYATFAWFREQACIAVCPYGRLQGVLLGRDSIVVAYDWIRGEPRAHRKKNAVTAAGDCIDCKLCVHVCPTGIDIRNGTQLECVNCTACIDVCNDVMTRIGRPKGLIRYSSYEAIRNGVGHLFTTRVAAYSTVLLGLVGFLSFALATRSDVETTILKVSGTLYQKQGEDITNLYNARFVNKTFEDLSLTLRMLSPQEGQIVMATDRAFLVPAEGMAKSVFFIRLPARQISNASTTVRLGVFLEDKLIETVKVKFIGPVTRVSDAKRN